MEPYFNVRDRNSQQTLPLTHHKMKQIARRHLINKDETYSKKTASTTEKVQGDTCTLDKTVVSFM
jgi:hypothetical protein